MHDQEKQESIVWPTPRGSSWGVEARCCRCAYRHRVRLGSRLDDLGFRCILIQMSTAKQAERSEKAAAVRPTQRGGSWHNLTRVCRCAFRLRYHSDDRNHDLGFRCILVRMNTAKQAEWPEEAAAVRRIFRGGSWFSVAHGCRCAYHIRNHPVSRNHGFRCILVRTSIAKPEKAVVVKRVFRGGSWNTEARGARCACRDRSLPDVRYDLLGFRCVLTKQPKEKINKITQLLHEGQVRVLKEHIEALQWELKHIWDGTMDSGYYTHFSVTMQKLRRITAELDDTFAVLQKLEPQNK